jgi:hypothetical protein
VRDFKVEKGSEKGHPLEVPVAVDPGIETTGIVRVSGLQSAERKGVAH